MGDCACHADDLHLKWDGNHLAFAFLELTDKCNNLCQGCSNVFARDPDTPELSGAVWIDIIRRLEPHIRWLKLTGGEPTLHPEFESIIALLGRRDIAFRLLTNGRWADPVEMIAMLQKNPALESLLISLHGLDAASHEAFSGVLGSFEETVDNIQAATRAGLDVTLSVVITKFNWDQVEALIPFARSLGAQSVAFNRYIGSPLPDLEANPEEVKSALQRIWNLIEVGAPVRMGTPVPHCLRPMTLPCLAGRAFITVDPWGRVRPCNHASRIIGDLKTQTLEMVLDSESLSNWLRDLPKACADCSMLVACGVGCRAEARLRPPIFSAVTAIS
jgi:radical SAM protein with 4Fe4S-binding SPASM domain